jgi:hypothetical protein
LLGPNNLEYDELSSRSNLDLSYQNRLWLSKMNNSMIPSI